MSLTMYESCVPVLKRALANLSHILDKGAAFAEAKGIDPSVLINDRLAPDMLPFAKQIQIGSDMAVRGAARLAGAEIPSNPDTETSFPEFQDRLAHAQAFLDSLSPDQFEGSETRDITVPLRSGDLNFTGAAYLTDFVMPNVYFHVTAAYLILRHNGCELGKRDFLGPM